MSEELRILIVEDVPTDAELMKRELKKGGILFTSRLVETKEGFLRELKEFTPDIILSDYKMPQFDGMTALSLTKEFAPNIPFIIVTGSMNEETAVACMKAGAADYVIKDHLARVSLAVKGALGNKQVREEKERLQEALWTSAREWRTTFDALNYPVALMNLDRNIRRCNKAMANLLGKPFSEIIGRNCCELMHSKSEPIEGCPVERMRETQERETLLLTLKERWFDIVADPVFDENKNFVGAVHIISDITENKRAEEALRESEEKYRTILEAIEEGYFEVDIAGNFTFFNDSLCKMLGYSKDEMMGMNNRQYMDKENAQKVFQAFNQVYTTGEPHLSFDWEILRKDGVKRFIESSVSMIRDSKGGGIGFRGIVRDITNRKQVEDTLRESEKRYRQVIENATEIIYSIDTKGNFTYGNPADLKATGFSLEELRQYNYQDLVVPEHREGITSIYIKQFRERQATTYVEFPFFNKSGEIIWFGQNASLVIEDGKVVGFHIIARDITERKRAEEELKKSEERFRELYDNAPVGYFEYNSQGRITSVNRTELEMLGYTLEEMIGHPLWKFVAEEGTVRQQILGKIAGTIPPARSLERTYQRKDGTLLPVLIEDRLLRDENGKITGVRSTIQDITDRKRAEEEKAVLQEQLRQSQKIEAIGRLAGGIAHDFNNLLTVIKGYSQLSLIELKEDVPLRGNIEEIKKASEKAADLTRQLLAFSRRQILETRVLDLNTVLRDMDKMLHRLIGEDIELITLLADDLGRVKTDPGWVEQIIMNLAVNARDAMPSVGKLTIETANVELDGAYALNHIAVTPGRYVMLSVSDTGVGMTPEVRQQVFEPFFTTKEKGKGTGLGLSTVYGIVKQSGGNIWVYSEPGKGTTFKIYLPRVDEPLVELKGEVTKEELPRGDETILVVEDEEDLLKLAERILSRQGYTVLQTSSTSKAVEICKERTQPIHLILTDVVMPQMSGRELVEQCRKIREDFKILYMSGYTDNTIVHHGVLAEGLNYIQKPFTVDGLARKVREVLDK